ncbi:MAG TPA: cytochrome d ubiquinol oxidase subunit II [Caulobacteraceae bacterium]
MEPLSSIQQAMAFAWWVALGVCVLLYIALDGADLGAGIFSLFVDDEHERGAIMASMAGTWDMNETWLVVAGGILFATFPAVYGSTFSYLFIPLALALWAIMTRAVAMELRHLAHRTRRFTDLAFGLSSLATTFFGGVAIGAVLHGYVLTPEPGHTPTYAGGALSFISPFSIWTGVASVVAVTLAGVLYVRARFEKGEPIREQAARWTQAAFYVALVAVVVTVAWSAVEFPWAASKWFSSSAWVWALFLIGAVYAIVQMRRATTQDRDVAALLWYHAGAVVMGVAMMATLYPWLVPNDWTIFSGASPQLSLTSFTLAMGSFLPVMFTYNAYQIWVFRGRLSKFHGYHH